MGIWAARFCDLKASTVAYHLKSHFNSFTSTAGGPLPDRFVEGYSPEVRGTSKETTESTSPRGPLKGVQEVVEAMKSFCNKELVHSVKGVFEFHLTGKEPGVWHLDLKNDAGKLRFCSRRISKISTRVFCHDNGYFFDTFLPSACFCSPHLACTVELCKHVKRALLSCVSTWSGCEMPFYANLFLLRWQKIVPAKCCMKLSWFEFVPSWNVDKMTSIFNVASRTLQTFSVTTHFYASVGIVYTSLCIAFATCVPCAHIKILSELHVPANPQKFACSNSWC